MTAKLVALYAQPVDSEAFDKAYFETHVPLVEKMPGLRKCEVTKLKSNLMGTNMPYYMIAELTFDSSEALHAALSSPEGKAAGANLMGFASTLVTLLNGEDVPVPIAVG